LHLTLYALFALEGYVARVIVDVMLKPEIHDPQGEAVLSASHRLASRMSPECVRASGLSCS